MAAVQGGAHIRGLTPGQYSLEDMMRRAVDAFVSDSTHPRIEPHTSWTANDVVATRQPVS